MIRGAVFADAAPRTEGGIVSDRQFRYATWICAMLQARILASENGWRYRVYRDWDATWVVIRTGRRKPVKRRRS